MMFFFFVYRICLHCSLDSLPVGRCTISITKKTPDVPTPPISLPFILRSNHIYILKKPAHDDGILPLRLPLKLATQIQHQKGQGHRRNSHVKNPETSGVNRPLRSARSPAHQAFHRDAERSRGIDLRRPNGDSTGTVSPVTCWNAI